MDGKNNMPELPEVETVRRVLETQIIGEKITNVVVRYDGILEDTTKDDFCKKLIGESFVSIKRRGKYLIFILNHVSIISHLRMEGKFFLKKADEPFEKHEHIIFAFASGMTLRYHDTRKFGKMTLLDTTDLNTICEYKSLKKLGPDANTTSDPERLFAVLKTKNVPIKVALLDQTILAGLGNIYVDEVCFLAKLNPRMHASKVTIDDVQNILKISSEVLNEAIKEGGTTIRSYTSSLGVTGRFQGHLHVHTKEGEPCEVCKTPIIKEVVGGRGTYICPKCQHDIVKIVGITGVIASGKSTIVEYLKTLGYKIVDTDAITHELLKTNSDTLKTIMMALEEKYKDAVENIYQNETLNREEMRKKCFEDADFKKCYEGIIHPMIKNVAINKLNKTKNDIILDRETKEIVFFDVPLLYEASFNDLCDEVLIIDAPKEQIIERLKLRNGFDEAESLKIINNQMGILEKENRAKLDKEKYGKAYNIIVNDNSKDELYDKINKLYK